MPRPLAAVTLSPAEREALEKWAGRRKTAQGLATRARILMLADEGASNKAIAADLAFDPATVSRWRNRFLRDRVAVLYDRPRSCAPRRIDDAQVEALVLDTLERRPEGATHWSLRLIAKRHWDCLVSTVLARFAWMAVDWLGPLKGRPALPIVEGMDISLAIWLAASRPWCAPQGRARPSPMIRLRTPQRTSPPGSRKHGSCDAPAIATFAWGLEVYIAAVRAALREPWSSGQAEGQVNRLKLIKRQCYGQAGLDLLKRRMVLAA